MLHLLDLRINAELLPESSLSGPLVDEALRLKTYIIVPIADNKSKVTWELVRAFMKKLASMK
jgi:hypothetical protein